MLLRGKRGTLRPVFDAVLMLLGNGVWMRFCNDRWQRSYPLFVHILVVPI